MRSLAIGGALTASLAVASPASAALGGGPAAVFDNRPSLESITFDGEIASFKFNRPVNPEGGVLDPTEFFLQSYIGFPFGFIQPGDSAAIGTDPTVVEVTYTDDGAPSGDLADFDETPVGTVVANAVVGLGTFNQPNLSDSTRVTGADGESGTRGHTSAPDLQSVVVDPTNNRIRYAFDQLVSDSDFPPTAAGFGFVDVNGVPAFGASIVTVSGNVVVVQFAAADDVDDARQALVLPGAALAPRITVAIPNATTSVDITGKNPLTAAPSIRSATLEPNSGSIVYQYDQPVTIANPNGFQAVDSAGIPTASNTAVVQGNGTQVRATFATSQFSEHIVAANENGGAVQSNDGANTPSIPSGADVGGNAGAKASGFTSAPDGLAASVNDATGQIVVLTDSRIAAVNAAAINLLASDGTIVATPAAGQVTFDTSTGPSQARLIVQVTPLQAQLSEHVQLNFAAAQGTHPVTPFSAPQILPLAATTQVFTAG